MSANNWAICPRCKIDFDKKRAELVASLKASYGKVPADEYLLLKEATDEECKNEQEQTLREDWGIGTDPDGQFGVSYSAKCECGFAFHYEHEEQALNRATQKSAQEKRKRA
jgi:hypothetical protein